MAGIFNKFINSMKLDDDYDDEEFEPDEEFEDLDYREDNAKPRRFSRPSKDDDLDLDDETEDYKEKKSTFRPSFMKQSSQNVFPMRNKSKMEVRMVKPTSLSDAQEITDILLSGRAVVVNMVGISIDTAQRIIDFTSGACYSMSGNLQSISDFIFIITPNNIDLTGEFSGSIGGGSDSLNFNI